MKCELKGKKLLIEIDLDETGTVSSSEKSINHASTGGAKDSGLKVGGRDLKINLNAYTANPDYKK